MGIEKGLKIKKVWKKQIDLSHLQLMVENFIFVLQNKSLVRATKLE